MAKRLIRYLLNANGSIPDFVVDGGYFPMGYELVAVSIDDEQFYLPDNLGRLTRAQAIARAQISYNVDEARATEIVDGILARNGMQGYE